MPIGVAIAPPTSDNYVDRTIELAREAHAAGVGSVWFGQRFDYDAAALAALAGNAVPGLGVGTSAIPIFGRHPLLVAGQAQTAQAAAHGRFRLGLALGAPSLVEPVLGVAYDRPAARLREFVLAVRESLETGQASHDGEFYRAKPPMPTRLPGAGAPIPVLVAAMGPQALRVTGEVADGILPFLAGPRTLGEQIVPALTAAASAAGRPAPQVVAMVAGAVTDDVERARAAAAAQMAFYDRIPSYQRVIAAEGAERAADLAVFGDEETVAAGIARYFEAGATEVMLTQTTLDGEENRSRTWRLLGELSGRVIRSAYDAATGT
ncbi:TIGR03564 family F420-dependent LLM class oxidoreductase [Actinoplanes couchii]|uniref:Monooxygenase (Luciferase-like) n=1 Tax=Actinoplanes couchii TaxID=403638 RepID=A0ABQ3XQQ8_9ACTN|nr:TIGR03564 family F420-dependent LLM class oxidoreductase [Actinoplanes couchii]GID60857.1 putative monooxygenase (luciferase-like) [Actinoplanes couchii]